MCGLSCQLVRTKVVRPANTVCLNCHEEGYEELFTDWQNGTNELIQAIKDLLNETQKLSLSEDQKSEIGAIRQFLDKIETDGSHGLHNYMFIEETLTSFRTKLESF